MDSARSKHRLNLKQCHFDYYLLSFPPFSKTHDGHVAVNVANTAGTRIGGGMCSNKSLTHAAATATAASSACVVTLMPRVPIIKNGSTYKTCRLMPG